MPKSIASLAPIFLMALISLTSLSPVLAQDQPKPAKPSPATQDIVLTISGLDGPQDQLRLDRAALDAFGPVSFTTSTIWTEGQQTFTGIPLLTLAQALDVPPDAVVTLKALNDYQVDIPLTEMSAEAPILAYEIDGIPMSVRDKGPIWLVYPYDADDDFRTVTVYARSIWQLDRVEFSR